MFQNYLITALRNVARHKHYSFINIAGLTIGLACAIFIILFVRDQISYDRWIPGTERLYRVEWALSDPGEPPMRASGIPFPWPDAMAAQLPEVKAAVHLEPYLMTAAVGDRQFLDHVDVVSPNFFQLIQLPLIAGDRFHVFAQPETAVITESAAFQKQFLANEQQGRIFGIFVGIAIFIAALGLFGLAAFSTERRTKEIGLRKTFGARARDIILMLLWQFSIPVLVANVIAWPIAYYYLHGWLEGYAYRISLSPLYFVSAGLAALVIAWATVIVHAAHVARANPIHALRYE